MQVPVACWSEDKIRKFYQSYLPQLPPNPQWRQFKFACVDGSFRVVPFQVRTPEELQKWLVKFAPRDAYVSVSQWLNPSSLHGWKGKRQRWSHASKVLISSDFFWEVDADLTKPDGKREAFGNLALAYELLSQKYSDFGFVETHRGFQMWCFSHYEKECSKKIASINNRIRYVATQKAKTVKLLKDAGVGFDIPQSLNVFQIARVWGSLHRSGKVVYYSNDWEEFINNCSISVAESQYSSGLNSLFSIVPKSGGKLDVIQDNDCMIKSSEKKKENS